MAERINGILLGDSKVGKTSILNYMNNQAFSDEPSTAASSTYTYDFLYKEKDYQLSITDTAGQEAFRAITQDMLRNKEIFVFVTSVEQLEKILDLETGSNPQPQDDGIMFYTQKAMEMNESFASVFVINKIDLQQNRSPIELKVGLYERIKNLQCAPKHYDDIFVVSCKTEANMRELVEAIYNKSAQYHIDHLRPDPPPPPPPPPNSHSSCCS